MPRKTYEVSPGDKYNSWMAMEHSVKSKERVMCVCSCGDEYRVQVYALVNGDSKMCRPCSCKAAGLKRRVDDKRALQTRIFNQIKSGAKDRGKPFSLTREEVIFLVSRPCHYCGHTGSNIMRLPSREEGLAYNGIDRFDNAKGYEIGNVLPCCRFCNYMKRDLAYEDFISHVRKVVTKYDKTAVWNYLGIAHVNHAITDGWESK